MGTRRIDQLTAHPKTVADSLALTSNLVVRDAALSSDNTCKVTLQDVRGVTVLATDFGAQCDGVTDDAAAIQAAIDWAHGIAVGNNLVGGAVIEFPPNPIKIGSTLTWKTGAWLRGIGTVVDQGTRFVWAGAAGGTMIQAKGDFRLIEGIAFYPTFSGSTAVDPPGTYIEFESGFRQDFGCVMRNLVFTACSGDAIKMPGYINLHMRDIRWDAIGGYAINFTFPSDNNGGSFVLDGWTFDNREVASPGIFLLDNTVNLSSIGAFKLSHARIEQGIVPMANPNGVVVLKGSFPGNYNWALLNLDNLYYQSGGHPGTYWMLHIGDNVGATPCSFVMNNCWSDGVLYFTGFDAGAAMNQDEGTPFSVMGIERPMNFIDTWARFNNSYQITKPIVQIFHHTEANERLKIDAAGILYRGPGDTTAPTTKFLRGTGSPEAAVTGGVGSLYQREDGSAGTSLYIKESGSGSTGWKALVGV